MRAAAERLAGPLVNAARRALSAREVAERRPAADFACCDMACGDTDDRLSRFKAFSEDWARFAPDARFAGAP